jgi:hypothetical protein
MSRRLVYAALFITSVVVSACATPTGPTRSDTTGDTTGTCRGGFVIGGGRCES